MNRHQQDVIAYIQEEKKILRSKLKGRRIRFTDDERRRLAVMGKALGSKILRQVASIFHFGTYTIAEAKAHMRAAGVNVRDEPI